MAQLAGELELSDILILGPGELKSGGFRRESIQADAVEAYFWCRALDSDFETINRVILDLYHDLLDDINPNDSLKDPKTQLTRVLTKAWQHTAKIRIGQNRRQGP